MSYEVQFAESVRTELAEVKPYQRRPIINAIENQLPHQPNVVTRNRKQIQGSIPDFGATVPIWELRVGDYRIFYEVRDEPRIVEVLAIRFKPPHSTTEAIL